MARETLELLLLLILVYAGPTVEGCSNATVVKNLTAALLAEYERDVRPPPSLMPSIFDMAADNSKALNGTTLPTRVAIELDVRHARIDEIKGTAIIVADLYMAWIDTRLQWNSTDWGIEAAYVDADEVWRPDVALLNAAETTESDVPARVALTSHGAAMWVPRLHASVLCQLTVDTWPQDEQQCGFEFGSRMYFNDEITYFFHTYEKDEMSEREAGNWAAKVVASEQLDVKRENGHFSAMRWLVSVRRRGTAHAVTTRGVTAAVVLLLVSAMLVEAGARGPLHAAAAVAATLHLTVLLTRLPPAANSPRVLRLHVALLIIAAVSAVCAALVVRVSRLSGQPSPALRRILLRTTFATGYREDQNVESRAPSPQSCDWVAASRVLDILLHMIVALTIFVLLSCYMWF